MKTGNLRDAVNLVLDAVAKRNGPSATERQYLREVIDFANTGSLGRILASVPDLNVDHGSVYGIQHRLRTDLQAMVDEELTLGARQRIYAQADRLVKVPKTGPNGARRYRYVPASLEAAVCHALGLLLDAGATQYRDDLKQCQWRDCNRIEDARNLPHVRRFFFVSERREAAAAAGKSATGKLPDQYCSEEHMRAAHRARATEATLRRRKEQRERKLKLAAARAANAKAR